jgi:hypothetical protein
MTKIYSNILYLPALCRTVLAIRIVAAVAIVATIGGVTLLFLSGSKHAAPIPPTVAATVCHYDLAALGRTLPFVPLSTHDRKAAHRWLRRAYAETDAHKCRRIAGMIVFRFISQNPELRSL